MNLRQITSFLPEISRPTAKKLPFNSKLKWTGITLLTYFIFLHIPLYALGENALGQFEALSTILGASFGSIISLGIGPIVTASIVLQLLSGSGILKIDTSTVEGRSNFQALQKILTIAFILFESVIFVIMGGLSPSEHLIGFAFKFAQIALIAQLAMGAYILVLLDELITKWGFGSGVGLFIAAGVSRGIFITAFSPFQSVSNPGTPVGRIPFLLQALSQGNPTGASIAIASVIATILVFLLCVYGQAMKVEIPMSFGRVRGYGIRWPLRFMYTSNIPVILIAALMANIQLWARLLQNWGHPFLGTFSGGSPSSGLVRWIQSPNLVRAILSRGVNGQIILQSIIYSSILIFGSILFSVLWVKTANMDADAQAKQILGSGLQIPGFRRDPRVLESILKRYIPGLTVMGGAMVGALAAIADLSGALSRGTGILLAIMIIYRLYEEIAKQHAMDMHPALKKLMHQ